MFALQFASINSTAQHTNSGEVITLSLILFSVVFPLAYPGDVTCLTVHIKTNINPINSNVCIVLAQIMEILYVNCNTIWQLMQYFGTISVSGIM